MPARQPENLLIDQIGSYYHNPLGFVLFAFEWGKGDLAGFNGPDKWQAELLKDLGSGVVRASEAVRYAVASGHGVGKSALVAWIVLWAMSTRVNLAGIVTANTQTQLQDKTWRELALWHKRAINSHWFKWTATKFYQVDNPETWFVAAVAWSKDRPEAFAGLHAEHVLVIYDEASAIEDIIWETSEGAMTTSGAMWLAFGNPTRNTGRFKDCFSKFGHRWQTRQIDSRQAAMANQAQIQQWFEDYGEDSDFFRIRVRGVFPHAASNQLISFATVEAAIKRQWPEDVYMGAAKIMGVDVARFGDDDSAIIMRQGLRAYALQRFHELDTMALADVVANEINLHKPDAVFIDQSGVGAGVVDRLRQLGHQVVGIEFGARAADSVKYANKRAEMWGNMRDWLAFDLGAIPDDRQLADELIAPEYSYTRNSQLLLEKKEDMKKRGQASPDAADALALTFAFPVAPRGSENNLLHARNQPNQQKSYDPWDSLDCEEPGVRADMGGETSYA